MSMKWLMVLVLALTTPTAMAAQAYVDIQQRLSAEQLRATGLDTLTPEQLGRLNEILRQEVAPASHAVAEQKATSESSRGLSSMIGLNDAPIHSRLKGSISSWEPGTVFELENGQQWKVLKGSAKLRKPFDSPEVIVVPGIAGRWFFQLNEDIPRPRVYLIN